MAAPRYSLLRDLIAFAIIVVACPVALFGGSMVGCVGQGFSSACALNAVFISPVVLMAAGVAAGIASRGWTGFVLVFIATVVGMAAVLGLSYAGGTPVPLDPISGVIATVWFFAPVALGYGIGRLVWRMFASRTDGDGDKGWPHRRGPTRVRGPRS